MPTAPDKLAVEQLQAALAAVDGRCSYFTCPGPDSNRTVNMATCYACYATIMLRRALKRMNIPAFEQRQSQ